MNLEKLKQLRLSKGYSQSEMAKLLKVTQPQYNRIERGVNQAGITQINRIAIILGTSIENLLR